MPSPEPVSTGGVGPVARAFRLVQMVVAADGAVGVRELSRRSGLPRSTVSRLVGSLTELGMLSRGADGSVLAGTALGTLQPDGPPPALRDQLRPLLDDLAGLCGENAALSVDGGDALDYVEEVRADNPVSVPDVASARHPFHLVAPGIVTMAWWDGERLDDYLARGLAAATPTSTTSPRVLRRRIRDVRATGYAWTDEELEIGVNGLAAPIVDDDGELLATVSLFGPSYRFSPTSRPELAERLTALVAERAGALLHGGLATVARR